MVFVKRSIINHSIAADKYNCKRWLMELTWLVDWEPPPSLAGLPSLPQDLRHHLLPQSGLVLRRSGCPSHPGHTQSTFFMFYFLIASYCDASLIVHCLWSSFAGESKQDLDQNAELSKHYRGKPSCLYSLDFWRHRNAQAPKKGLS